MTKNRQTASGHKVTPALAAQIGTAVFLCAFPLYLQNKYMEMTHAKMLFFSVCAVVLFAVAHMVLLSTAKRLEKQMFAVNKPHEIALLCFGGFAAISCLLAASPSSAFTGVGGRYMGFMTVLACIAAFFAVSRFFKSAKWVVYAFAGGSTVLNGIAILQYIGFNPFGLYTGATEKTVQNFISTLGNQNVYSAYLCLVIPFFLYFTCVSKTVTDKIIGSTALLFGFLGVFAAKSDGSYLGLAVALVVLLFFAKKQQDLQKGLVWCGALYFAAALLIFACQRVPSFHCFELSYLSQFATDWRICLPCMAALLLLFAVLTLVKIPQKVCNALFTAIFAISLLAFAGAIGAFICFTFIDTQTDIGNFAKFLRFDDAWGSTRGFIWRQCFALYKSYPPLQKLFGCGEDCLNSAINTYLGSDAAFVAANNTLIDNAHNELLHILTTHGICGLLSYLAFLFFCIKTAVLSAEPLKKCALFAVIGYLAQDTVNLWQPITAPLLFVCLALCVFDTPSKQRPPKKT